MTERLSHKPKTLSPDDGIRCRHFELQSHDAEIFKPNLETVNEIYNLVCFCVSGPVAGAVESVWTHRKPESGESQMFMSERHGFPLTSSL